MVEDVWALPTPGGPGELPRLIWAIFDDDHAGGLGSRVSSLRDRLPPELRAGSPGLGIDLGRFSLVYQLNDEFAAELANRTVHTVMHLGWVPAGAGAYRGQMAVLVKPNGRLGSLYMAGIAPLRHHLVYPAILRQIERQWRATAPA